MATTRLVTLEDLDDLIPEDERVEILGGELYQMPPASMDHGGIAFHIGSLIITAPGARDVLKGFGADAPFRLRRDPDDVVVPDAAFVRRDRLAPPGQRPRAFEGPPDIAVEVISPSDRPAVVALKMSRYLGAGTPAVLLVDPVAKTITRFSPDRDATVYGPGSVIDLGDIVAGLVLSVTDAFSD